MSSPTTLPPSSQPRSPRLKHADWHATYRLQLTPDFTFQRAIGVLDYLADLGISHIYLSPCLTATPGSSHGYDVADPTTVSEQLGGPEGLSRLARAARERGMSVLLDIVPNHMTTHVSNRFFRDVLCHGRLSSHAPKFDLYDVIASGERVCIGTLGKPYGACLDAREIQIKIALGRFSVTYFEHEFPLCPASLDILLSEDEGRLHDICERLRALHRVSSEELEAARSEYHREVTELEALLRERIENDAEVIQRRVQAVNDDPSQLHEVLEAQRFRLMWWRLEGEFVNYRRFFNIGSLVGARMDDPLVFEWAHQRIRALVRSGEVAGLRVDHPDGLVDPAAYFRQLREILPDGPIYAEKILDEDERLPDAWPVDGTVGYDFLNRVNRLWMDETRAEALTSLYADFTGHPTNYLAVVREQKQHVLKRHFRGDLLRLCKLALKVAAEDYHSRDMSADALELAIEDTIVALPIYRTYLSEGAQEPQERQVLEQALALGRSFAERVTESRTNAFEFLERALLGPLRSKTQREFLARFQQLAPAVMAKGAEDTTFYRYDRLVSCNEVGSQPSALGISAEQFHQYLSHLRQSWPYSLLCTSTHDTKRSEDVRARISVLSEMPEAWHNQILTWAAKNAPGWRGRSPDRHAEYLLYQTLVGAHPLPQERAFEYIVKATREAKLHTSWQEPNLDYENKLREFIEYLAADEEFQASLEHFCQPLIYPGRVNSLSQTLIKLTAPGVPDCYQGTELWDLSLVDPDNRREVDFAERARLLAVARSLAVRQLKDHWESGLVKLWMMDRVLSVRRRCGGFGETDYRPLIARGEKLRHVLSYTRGNDLVVVVPRFMSSIGWDFGDTELVLPEGPFECVLSNCRFEGAVPVKDLFGQFPVSLLARPSLFAKNGN